MSVRDITENPSVGSKQKNESRKLRRGGDKEGRGSGGSMRTGDEQGGENERNAHGKMEGGEER